MVPEQLTTIRSVFGAISAATIRWKSELNSFNERRSNRSFAPAEQEPANFGRRSLLDHFGHEISSANGAQSALKIVESKEFDVVLSDIGLPDGSGYEVIAHAKRKQPIKGVALTGLDKEEDIRRSKEAGFDFHLSKPVDFHELCMILTQVGS
jgi:CheY-like chemotaxis protein